jgi:UDP-N-acetylmuramate dehydrogenase
MLGYRNSIFHSIEGIILLARFNVEKVETKLLLAERLKKRKQTQPLECKSMGSIFKNNLLIPSYKIVDLLNMRGFKINDIEVSKKHSNFIINTNEGNPRDVLKMIELIQKRARTELGVNLEYEITLIN